MINKTVKVLILLLGIIFLVSCTPEVTYKEGLPSEGSSAFQAFLKDYALIGYNEIKSEDGTNIITEENWEEKTVGGISYLQYTDNELSDFYKPLADEPKEVLTSIHPTKEDKGEKLFHPMKDNDSYQLPTIEFGDEFESIGDIHIETAENEKTIHSDNHDVEWPYAVNILKANEAGFVLKLEEIGHEPNDEETYYLFADNALEYVYITPMIPEKAPDMVSSGELADFQSLFPSAGNNWVSLFDEPYAFNIETGRVREVEEDDYFSEDGGYVYLNGNERPVSDGVQRIQTIDDYAKDNDEYEAEFKIDFKEIGKKLELDINTPNVEEAYVMYFNKDFIVLRLDYNDNLGHGVGSPNVLIDLQEQENPTAYLIDLGWG